MGVFHNPYDYGDNFDLAISQNESPVFTFDTDVVSPKIVAFRGTTKIKTYTPGSGLTVSNDNRTVTWDLAGSDFARHIGQKVSFEMTFFNEGSVEYTMQINIKDSSL